MLIIGTSCFWGFYLFYNKYRYINRFILVDIGEVGRHSDGGVLSNSAFGQALEEGTLCLPPPSPLPGSLRHVGSFVIIRFFYKF